MKKKQGEVQRMKRFLLLTCSLSLLIGLFAGCGQKAPTTAAITTVSQAPAQSAATQAGSQPSEPVNMRMSWWGGDSRHKATLAVFDAYAKLHPNVKIEGEYSSYDAYYTKLLTQLASNTAPDIIQVDYKWVSDLCKQKENFVNLKDSKVDLSQISPAILDAYASQNGFVLGLPVGINAFGIIYNVNAIKEMGITLPETPDWDDLLTFGKEVNQKDKTKYLLIPQNGHYYIMFKSMMYQLTGKNLMNDADATLNITEADAVKFFEYLKQLFDTHTIPPIEETQAYALNANADQMPPWHDQKYLIHTSSASTLPAQLEASPFDVDVIRWPVMEGAKNSGIFTPISMVFSINSNSKYIDQAVDFINWYAGDEEAIKIMGVERGVPANQKAAALLENEKIISPQVSKLVSISISNSGLAESAYDYNPELQTIFDGYYQQIGYNKMTPQKAAEGYIADLKKALAAKK
jgi:oligogalacturonide transport system substrate-binding protein